MRRVGYDFGQHTLVQNIMWKSRRKAERSEAVYVHAVEPSQSYRAELMVMITTM
jgi:hypothetical protein